MSKMRSTLWTVLCASAFLQCVDSATLPPNPCPNVFQYQQDKNGVIYGRVMLENDYSGDYSFKVNMSIAAYLFGVQDMKTEMESTTDDIVAGRLLVYNITFPIQSVIPRLTRIELNKKVYCSGPPEELDPIGVTDMFAAMYYGIDLPSKRPPAEPAQKLQLDISSLTQQPPIQDLTTFFGKPWQQPSTISDTFTPLPWESWQTSSTESLCASPWQQYSTDLNASKSLSRRPSWLLPRDSTDRIISASLSPSPCQPPFTASGTSKPLPWKSWQQPLTTSKTPGRVPSWLLVRHPTPPTTSASLFPNPWQPFLTASATNAPLPTRTRPDFSTSSTSSASLSSTSWQPSLTASTTDTPLPTRTLWPFSTASTTFAPLSSKTSTPSTKPLQFLPWLSLGSSMADTTGSSLTEDFSLSGKECGLSMINTQELAVDEDDFVDGQFPWLVAILYRKNLDYSYTCTGSLVSNRHVITAGHCVKRKQEIENYLLVFGKKKVQNWANGAEHRELQNISVHPDYVENKKDADIAILTLKMQIAFEANVKPVCLWHGEQYANRMAGMQGTVAGWWMNGKRRDIDAKKIDLPIVSQTECLRSSPNISSVVSSRTFCAGLKGAGPCHGDSGAGFAVQKNGRWILRGVVFTALGDLDSCDVENYFVFVDIDKVMSWLKQVMK